MILFDKNNNIIKLHDLQDKISWCEMGILKENEFIEKFGNEFNLEINPEKERNKRLPDLKYTDKNKLADLKTKNTPLFTSQKYNLSPQTTITFDVKDRNNYSQNYPDIDIFFWIDWTAVKYQNGNKIISVNPMNGVWLISFVELNQLCENAPIHVYQQRINDVKGNAKDSYVLSILNKQFKKIA